MNHPRSSHIRAVSVFGVVAAFFFAAFFVLHGVSRAASYNQSFPFSGGNPFSFSFQTPLFASDPSISVDGTYTDANVAYGNAPSPVITSTSIPISDQSRTIQRTFDYENNSFVQTFTIAFKDSRTLSYDYQKQGYLDPRGNIILSSIDYTTGEYITHYPAPYATFSTRYGSSAAPGCYPPDPCTITYLDGGSSTASYDYQKRGYLDARGNITLSDIDYNSGAYITHYPAPYATFSTRYGSSAAPGCYPPDPCTITYLDGGSSTASYDYQKRGYLDARGNITLSDIDYNSGAYITHYPAPYATFSTLYYGGSPGCYPPDPCTVTLFTTLTKGSAVVSGDTGVSPAITQVISPVTYSGYGGGADIVACPDGTYVAGFSIHTDDVRGASVTFMDRAFCATLPQGSASGYSYRRIGFHDTGGSYACAGNEYVKGFIVSRAEADRLGFGNINGLACAPLAGTADAGPTISTPKNGVYAAGANQFVRGLGVYFGWGPDDARAPRVIIENYSTGSFGAFIVPPPYNLTINQSDSCSGQPPQPAFSWQFDGTGGQSAYQVQVATDSGFSSIVVDSGKVGSSSHSYVAPANTLSYRTTYYWHVRAWNTSGTPSEYSSAAAFTTPPHQGPSVSFTWAPQKPVRDAVIPFTNTSTYYGGSSASGFLWTFPPHTTLKTPPPTDATEKVSFNRDAPKTGNVVTLQTTDSDGLTCSGSQSVTLTDSVQEFKEVR